MVTVQPKTLNELNVTQKKRYASLKMMTLKINDPLNDPTIGQLRYCYDKIQIYNGDQWIEVFSTMGQKILEEANRQSALHKAEIKSSAYYDNDESEFDDIDNTDYFDGLSDKQ